jgi:hypothetical protein
MPVVIIEFFLDVIALPGSTGVEAAIVTVLFELVVSFWLS